MKCSNCGHLNVEGSRYCNQCAFSLNSNKVSLGQYEDGDQAIYAAEKQERSGKYMEDSSRPFSSVIRAPEGSDEIIYDRDVQTQKVKRPVVLKMTLVIFWRFLFLSDTTLSNLP
ncbi:hypothetical protein ACHAL6_10095 [Proteiniclasticum sp. C24MP]|uniref:hypothetical protein n=1 Tax=Proteiniclasticum sp. C24MP TaxID=3374101 RepID=UPI003753F456